MTWSFEKGPRNEIDDLFSDRMMSTYFFLFALLNLLHFSRKFSICFHLQAVSIQVFVESLHSGYTCEASVKLTCPKSRILVILEATYSSKCNEDSNTPSIYAPSHCIGYYRERISTQCNGQENCTVDNSPDNLVNE